MSGKNRFLCIAALAAGAVLALSCGGGGGGGTGTGLVISWSPGTNPLGIDPGDVVLRESGASTPSNLILEVVVYGELTEVFGIAFHLTFNDTILNFVSAVKTDVLDDGDCSDACVAFPVDNSTPGLLIVGMSRTNDPATGVDLPTPDAPYVFMTLEFQPLVAGGPSALSFVDAESQINDPVEPPTDLSNDWVGGTVSVS